MRFSYTWLQSFFKTKLPAPNKLAELLTLHSFEVEAVEKRGQDFVLDIDVTPNRPDCFSHLGIARECSAVVKSKFIIHDSKFKEGKDDIRDLIEIKVENKNDCPRYTGRVITGVKVGPSPKYIQQRLKAVGLEPINNIVDAANYVMLEMGQPLHVFDFNKIKNLNSKLQITNNKQILNSKFQTPNKKIIIRRAREGEKIAALDDKTYELDKNVLVIADSKKPLAIAGIKGGRSTAVDKDTKSVFLESANFNPLIIRKASQRLKLRTDASFRFEHGLDPEMTAKAVDRLAQLIQEIAGGKIAKSRVDEYAKKPIIKKIKLDLEKTEKVLGIKLKKAEAKKILEALQFRVNAKLEVTVPSNRQDIAIQEDLIEELGRIYGYEKLKSASPKLSLVPAKRNETIFWQARVKDFLKQVGFSEIYSYSFISQKTGDNFGGPLVELENPFSKQFYYLRPNLLLNLLANLKENRKHLGKDVPMRFFELGKVFRRKDKQIEEKNILAALIAGEGADFYVLKGLMDSLLESMSITDRFYDDFEQTPEESKMLYWNLKRAAELKVAGKEIGFLGELSEIALKHIGLKEKVFALEIDFEKLIRFASEEAEYRPISKFPTALRDIAVLVPKGTKTAEVLNVINIAGGKLLRDVDLFDIYQADALAEGKKNLAFHLKFQAEDRTLSAQEIDALQGKIIRALERKVGWQVRK